MAVWLRAVVIAVRRGRMQVVGTHAQERMAERLAEPVGVAGRVHEIEPVEVTWEDAASVGTVAVPPAVDTAVELRCCLQGW
jgi:hypothetical protein